VLRQLVQRDFDIALVLLTASGKLLLYMLLRSINVLGVIIVILLLIALLNEVIARYEQQHVPYITWTAFSNATVLPVGASALLSSARAEQAVLLVFSK
jgi:ABC-type multidrug transport system permease subunit